MRDKFRNNLATIAFITFLAIGAGYSLYTVIWQGPSKAAVAVNSNLRLSCERNKARSQIFQEFALEAASARRRNAEMLANQGNEVGAQNEIATAKKYEGFAERYNNLTVHDCATAYPDP